MSTVLVSENTAEEEEICEETVFATALSAISGHVPHGAYSFDFELPTDSCETPSCFIKANAGSYYSCEYFLKVTLHLPIYSDRILKYPFAMERNCEEDESPCSLTGISLDKQKVCRGETIQVLINDPFDSAHLKV